MKTILIACAVTVATFAVSTSAMASAVPDLDAVLVVTAKKGVIQVADKLKDKEEAYTRMSAENHHVRGTSMILILSGPPTSTKKVRDKKETYGTLKRKAPHYKRKSPRQCKKGQTAKCK